MSAQHGAPARRDEVHNPPMRGDVRMRPVAREAQFHRQACRYAQAMMARRDPLFSHCGELFFAEWRAAERTVIFTTESGLEVARYRIPDRVLNYDPARALLRVETGAIEG